MKHQIKKSPDLGQNLYNLNPNFTTSLAFPYVRKNKHRIKTFDQFKGFCMNNNSPSFSVINPSLYVNCMHVESDGSTLVDGGNNVASVYEAI